MCLLYFLVVTIVMCLTNIEVKHESPIRCTVSICSLFNPYSKTKQEQKIRPEKPSLSVGVEWRHCNAAEAPLCVRKSLVPVLLQKSTESTQPHTEAYRPPHQHGLPVQESVFARMKPKSEPVLVVNLLVVTISLRAYVQLVALKTGICDYISPSNKI